MSKLLLIGPVYPYKGGIAHYTSLMVKSLRKKYQVNLISFKRQYPDILYPGKKQKDFDNDRFKVEDTHYLIDTVNPLSWIKTLKAIKNFFPKTIVFHWWHPYFALCFSFIAYFAKKLIGSKVIILCHNVIPHERYPLDKFFIKLCLGQGDYCIVHSESEKSTLLELLPEAKVARTVHPTYNAFLSEDISKEQARKRLGIESIPQVILFFGFVREYKGLKYLLKAMPQVFKEFPELRLLVVGDFYQSKSEYLEMIDQLDIKKNISIFDGYIPDKEVGVYFSAADMVVLPYTSATQSGIVQIAYGFNKPVIATDVGGLAEVVIDDQTGFIVESKSVERLAESIIKYYKENKEHLFIENIIKSQEIYSWDRMTELVARLEEELN